MPKDRIVVISFDHWNYDSHIVTALKNRGVESHHIKIGAFKHKSFGDRMKNTFSKIFFNKNLKNIKRQEFILDTLRQLGKQDQILVINPELISKDCHLEIKKYTSKYIAYLYDSVARCPIKHLLDGIFDTIYSFDTDDVKQYGFLKTSNYIYTPLAKLDSASKPKYQAFYLASYDNRLPFLYKIKEKLEEIGISYLFIVVGKKGLYSKLKSIFQITKNSSSLKFKKNIIKHENMQKYYKKTIVVFDLVREHQTGLSFRVFEAMAFQKKLITNNPTIVNYDFYNPNNILLIDEKNINFNADFFRTAYQPIPESIYQQYTLNTWVETVFELKTT
jgi:hypothetical protein